MIFYAFCAIMAVTLAETNVKRDFTQDILKENINHPYQLAIDYNTDTLYFSYSVDSDDVFKSAYLNLKNNDFGTIPGLELGFANAVDNVNHIVYLGARNGIFNFDQVTKKAINLGITSHSVWQMFYKDGLYFTTYPTEEAYLYKNGVVKKVTELTGTKVLVVAVDNDHNLFFSNSTGLFCHKQDSKKIVNLGEYTVNGFTSDKNGNLYFSTPSALYYLEDTTKVKELISVDGDNIHGLAIEGNKKVICALEDSIVRLKQGLKH